MDDKLEILLVEDDPLACKDFTEQILDSDDMILIGVTNNANKAVDYIKDSLPDVVILDLELHQGSGNGLTVLQALQNLSLPKIPYILITTNNTSSTTYDMARKLGADFIISKHQSDYSTKMVLDFLQITRPVIKNANRQSKNLRNNTPETREQYNKRINRRIIAELNLVGINPKSVGYIYLVDAIAITMNQPVQNLCSLIAKKHDKTEASVERAMQNAINRAWKTNDIDELLLHYTAKINPAKGNPTVTEFIFYYATRLRNEY